SVGAGRTHGGVFVLRDLIWAWGSEDLGRRGVVEAEFGADVPADLEEREGRHRDFFAGGFRNLEAQADVALSGKMIDFLRFHLPENPPQRRGVLEIGVVKKKLVPIDLGIAAEVL